VRRAAACILLTGALCPKPNSRFHQERTYSLDGKVLEAPRSVNVVLTVRQYPPTPCAVSSCLFWTRTKRRQQSNTWRPTMCSTFHRRRAAGFECIAVLLLPAATELGTSQCTKRLSGQVSHRHKLLFKECIYFRCRLANERRGNKCH
jgi:hypothetical protein